ncbi:hypothetical protein NDU88_007674 [Pleurodeles waltl]|uniref:Uncharacterized protein n=1 Tax=Pleurodeles waltl TaxID=8319 RepID=A0AAV7NVJ8_PLEWA|nr:hypothetical protein NDU88_007674 [Pleurodeles waltl]
MVDFIPRNKGLTWFPVLVRPVVQPVEHARSSSQGTQRRSTHLHTRKAAGVGAAIATPLRTSAEAARSRVRLAGGIEAEGSAIQVKVRKGKEGRPSRTVGTRKLAHYPGCGQRRDPPARGR